MARWKKFNKKTSKKKMLKDFIKERDERFKKKWQDVDDAKRIEGS